MTALESLTDAERLIWAKLARDHAANWAGKADLIGNGSTAALAAQNLEFIDLIIAAGGKLPPRATDERLGS